MIFTLEIYLASLKNGTWFDFTDHNNKVYDNLIVLDGDKPTEQECIEGVKAMQADYDSRQYMRDRSQQYPPLAEQLDLLWHAIDTDTLDNKDYRNKFYTMLKKVKEDNPKG